MRQGGGGCGQRRAINLLGNSMLVKWQQKNRAGTDHSGDGRRVRQPPSQPRRGALASRRPLQHEGGGTEGMSALSLTSLVFLAPLFCLHRHGAHDGQPLPASLLPTSRPTPWWWPSSVPHPAHPVYQPPNTMGGLQDPLMAPRPTWTRSSPWLLAAVLYGVAAPHRLAPGPGGLWRATRPPSLGQVEHWAMDLTLSHGHDPHPDAPGQSGWETRSKNQRPARPSPV